MIATDSNDNLHSVASAQWCECAGAPWVTEYLRGDDFILGLVVEDKMTGSFRGECILLEASCLGYPVPSFNHVERTFDNEHEAKEYVENMCKFNEGTML